MEGHNAIVYEMNVDEHDGWAPLDPSEALDCAKSEFERVHLRLGQNLLCHGEGLSGATPTDLDDPDGYTADSGRTLTMTGPKDAAGQPMGWEALKQWGDDVARIEPLAGGVANDVWSVRIDGRLAVGRLGARSDADLAWETALLQHLDREGLTVPVPIPTTDGRLFADGVVVMTYLEGGPPETEADWRRVADTLRQLHRLTRGWPQRPGWRSSTDLLHAETGTKIDLGAMPPEGVARCRAAWARLVGRQTCVVHGDPNPRNVRMTVDRVALIDWDEAHVDVPDLDLALPHNAAGLADDAHDIAAQASAAWEAAVCWDDDYSVKRLAEVRAVSA
jgi:aminoglycoside phosphotransferase (APT) family kinase protein